VLPTGDNIPMPVTTTRRLDTIIFSGVEKFYERYRRVRKTQAARGPPGERYY